MTSNGSRPQFPLARNAHSPQPQYDSVSPSSNYHMSSVGSASPGLFSMAYQISPRYNVNTFIPPPDIFADNCTNPRHMHDGIEPPEIRSRSLSMLNMDPVAIHLLVETAIGDSQEYEILTVEEVDRLKQEQKSLDARLNTIRKKLDSETKIRDATRSLKRLTSSSRREHARGYVEQDTLVNPEDDALSSPSLEASNQKIEHFIRDLSQIASRIHTADTQLLMHTAAVLQFIHNDHKTRIDEPVLANEACTKLDGSARVHTYGSHENNDDRGTIAFDNRSLYRSRKNLEGIMDILKNGTHHDSGPDQINSYTLPTTFQRLREINARLANLIGQDRAMIDNGSSSLSLFLDSPIDLSAIDRQIDFLDENLCNLGIKQFDKNLPNNFRSCIEKFSHQIYNILSDTNPDAPAPPLSGDGEIIDQISYLEDCFQRFRELHDSVSNLAAGPHQETSGGSDSKKFMDCEATIRELWQIILVDEERGRNRKHERLHMRVDNFKNGKSVAHGSNPDDTEEFSLQKFSSKIQWLSRCVFAKDEQLVFDRNMAQRENLKNDHVAQDRTEFEDFSKRNSGARSVNQQMANEPGLRIDRIDRCDELDSQTQQRAVQEMRVHNARLKAKVILVQERAMAAEASLKVAEEQIFAYQNRNQEEQEKAAQTLHRMQIAEQRSITIEKELKDVQERREPSNTCFLEQDEMSDIFQNQIPSPYDEKVERGEELHSARNNARLEVAKDQVKFLVSAQKTRKLTTSNELTTEEKGFANSQSLEAADILNLKEEEIKKLETEIVRLTTELTFAKAELDGAYGTRAQRAADSAANPAIRKELDGLNGRNQALQNDLEALRNEHDVILRSESEARQCESHLKAELSVMATEYEYLTRDIIQNEKDREGLESQIDSLRDEKELLERELSEEKMKWLGVRSPLTSANTVGQLDIGATSIRMLREDFRKMMRDRTAEGLKALKAEQEERRKLEAVIRQLRREMKPQNYTPAKSSTL